MSDNRSRSNGAVPLSLLAVIFILVIGLGSGCQPAAPLPPTTTSEADAFAASEATIAAQLTGIAQPAGPITTADLPPTPTNPTSPGIEPPVETLPATSTPLPTETPYPTDTPEPAATSLPATSTPLVSAEPTLSPDNPKVDLGEPDWVDEFAAGVIEWPFYTDEHVKMQYAEGRLSMTALTANRRDPWDSWMVHPSSLTDFYVEVTAAPGQCSGLDRYGLLARAIPETNQTYLFGLSCDGKYSLRFWDGQKIAMLKEWTFHPSIQKGPGSQNVLGLLAVGSQISVFANDTLLVQVEDETLASGAIGLFVGAVMTDNFQVDISRVAYWELP